MTFSAIVCCHAQDPASILGNLIYQTRPPDEIVVMHSDTEDIPRLKELFPTVKFVLQENKNDWGHDKRAKGIEAAACEYLGFFNADDSYAGDYLEKMLGAASEHGADVVYCDWSGIADCAFQTCSSTAGNFIVRTSLARKVGYRDREYVADGTFINDIAKETDAIVKVREVLYFHNTN